ncbi:MAG: hypothetical protein ACRC6M_16270 [Microcystaceae cyanobacterium]
MAIHLVRILAPHSDRPLLLSKEAIAPYKKKSDRHLKLIPINPSGAISN